MVKILFAFFLVVSPAFAEEWKDLKKELRNLMRVKNSYSAQGALEKCSKYDETDPAEYLISLVKSSRTPVTYKMTACRVLSAYKNEEVRKLLAKEAKSSSDIHLLQSLTVQKDEHCEAVCNEIALRSNDPQLLTIAIRTLGGYKEHKADIIKKLISKLEPRTASSVRRAVAEALGSVNNPEVAAVLIQQMKDKAVASLAIDSMERLTGQSFGNAPSSWRKWLAENKDFKPVNTPLGEYYEAKRKKEEEEREKNKDHDSAEFYGVEIKGEKILFVLDRSGSMSAKTDYGSRLDQLKKEFTEMLDSLGYNKSLGLLWFPGNEAYPRSGIDEATDSFKDQLKKHIKGIKEGGGTPIGEAMTYAFEKIVEKREIDSIYLLSDGTPNGSPDDIRQLIKNLNASYFVKISTISIGASSDFLKNVAADNYGTYTEIK